jgi:hypothetical protein
MTNSEQSSGDMLFDALTPLKFKVHVTRRYWQLIVNVKHPVMQGREETVRQALTNPEEIRLNSSDPTVYLFYTAEHPGRWVCAVAKRENEDDGFLITAYPTGAIKEGVTIWPR